MSKIFLLCCALAFVMQAATVTVTATPPSVSFTYQIGTTTLPAAQTVTVKASSGTPNFTTSSPGADRWLTVSPASGKLPGSLSVRVNPTSLTATSYTSSVTVTVTGVATPLTIPVTLVGTPAPSTLTLSATTLNFVAPPLPPANQTVRMTTNGAPISFTATSGSLWLTVSPTVGTVLPGAQLALTVAVDSTSLTPQTAPYVGKITVVASGAAVTVKSQTITVNLTVNSMTPTITSIWPSTLPVNGPAQTITVRGTNFYSATVAKIQGVTTPLATTIDKNSSTYLLAVVPASLLTAAGTLNVMVTNPPPGGDSTTSAVAVASVPAILGLASAASYDATALSLGELVTIFGVNIGPTTPASMTITGDFVDTTLAGVSATVDGKAAPMIYVSQNQVTIQVPYEAAVGAGKQVVVTNGANPAANSTVTIAATAPGLFTADGSGAGQAAALNFNAATGQYSLNGSKSLAKIGDTVILYLTGEGDYNPTPFSGATNTGYVIPPTLSPLPEMSPLPTVTIGGVAATVSYAGPLYGSILGLLQINAVVPTGSTTGAAVPVVVTIGGNQTQANVTLATRP